MKSADAEGAARWFYVDDPGGPPKIVGRPDFASGMQVAYALHRSDTGRLLTAGGTDDLAGLMSRLNLRVAPLTLTNPSAPAHRHAAERPLWDLSLHDAATRSP